MLYGDIGFGLVRQGWELKMPDTHINDVELIKNAQEKASRLNLNSFLVWNVTTAVLYVDKDGCNCFTPQKQWGPIQIGRREDVQDQGNLWKALLYEVIDDLNNYFASGSLKPSTPIEALTDNLLASIIEKHQGLVAASVKKEANNSASFEADIHAWWSINKGEYGSTSIHMALARVLLINWLNRFLFAHYLKKFNSYARKVEGINELTSIMDAVRIFAEITSKCDFLQVFKATIGAERIDAETWKALTEFNQFLVDLKLESIDQESLHRVMERILVSSRRKIAGQYSTPMALAKYLVRLTIEDRVGDVLDPCCGTGTIARAVYDLKRDRGISIKNALKSTWASDKFQFPLQLCTIALADPQAMGEVTHISCEDAFDLYGGKKLLFTDPNDGEKITEELPVMKTVVSNLPFVRFEIMAKLNPKAGDCAQSLAKELGCTSPLSGRSDVFAYLTAHFRYLIQDSGRIGIIISNSWLGTDWGKQFRQVLTALFSIRYVVISSAGKWFSNADVVTTLLVLEKKQLDKECEKIGFVSTLTPIYDWNDNLINQMVTDTLVQADKSMHIKQYFYSLSDIQSFEDKGFTWQALFAGIAWVNQIKDKLVLTSSLFEIARGERRGWNAMFYPAIGHGIEREFIRPVLIRSRNIKRPIASSDAEAFCCSQSIDELKRNNKQGALAWISSFLHMTNTSGKPLIEVLQRADHHWYEMKAETQADLVLMMNPDKRLFVGRMAEKGFVDQRLIRLTIRKNSKLDISHALMNSTLGMLLMESSGFGRGLGALDLSATKLKTGLHMLNPLLLSKEQKNKILKAFAPILERDVKTVEIELAQQDRYDFDKKVLEAYGCEELLDNIRESLKELYQIRQAVRQ